MFIQSGSYSIQRLTKASFTITATTAKSYLKDCIINRFGYGILTNTSKKT
jgi:hypothetical protein